MDWRKRIVVDPRILVGKPTIKGTRISVGLVLEHLAAGCSVQWLLDNYPHITREDITACLACGAELAHAARTLPIRDW